MRVCELGKESFCPVCKNCSPNHQRGLNMIRYRDGREILALDLESRYGKDDPVVREVRASIPLDRELRRAPAMATASTKEPPFTTRSATMGAPPG